MWGSEFATILSTMDKHYLTPLFTPESIVVFAGRLDDPSTQTAQATAVLQALRAQKFTGTLQFLDIQTSGTLADLAQARADGTYFLLLRRLAKTEVLIVDDFGLEVLTASQRRDFLEVLEDRYGISSTVITSQLDPKNWHPIVGDETIADSVCDRLVHNAHKVKLAGDSLRKVKAGLTGNPKPAK